MSCASTAGVSVSAEDAEKAVARYMDEHSSLIEEQRWSALSSMMAAMKLDPAMRWAYGPDIKSAVEKSLEVRFGPKSQQAPPTKAAKESKAAEKKVS